MQREVFLCPGELHAERGDDLVDGVGRRGGVKHAFGVARVPHRRRRRFQPRFGARDLGLRLSHRVASRSGGEFIDEPFRKFDHFSRDDERVPRA